MGCGRPVVRRTQRIGDVAGGASYSSTITSSIPGINPGDYRIIIRSDIRNNIPESNENNNIGASLDLVDIDIESLTIGVPTTDTLSQGKSSFYRVDVQPEKPWLLRSIVFLLRLPMNSMCVMAMSPAAHSLTMHSRIQFRPINEL